RHVDGCDTGFYLQSILAEQQVWEETALIASETAACFEKEIAVLAEEIDGFRASGEPSERLGRQIAHRQDTIDADRRMQATAQFNTAVALYDLQQPEDARLFVQLVLDNPQFADRARALLAELDRFDPH
ncbi:MAG: hypothetical protein LBQ09_07485, partial [Acidobacteriaceae bacterium]|nr:hypothetical protein [Acidobacteriaceae bacterium]